MGQGGAQLVLFALLFAMIYFLMIRPQRQRVRQQQALQSSLQLGDEILTFSGFFGTIRRFDGDVVTIELSPGVEARVSRRAITGKVPNPVDDDELEELEEDGGGGDGARGERDHEHDGEAGTTKA